MPTYHSPSSSPSRSPSRSSFTSTTSPRRNRSSNRSRSRRRSPSSSLSRSPSRSLSRSRSSSRNRSSKKLNFPDDGLSESKSESIVKTSLVFLGSVAAATFAAHKFWPKGITYGEKEEWEGKQAKKAKRALREAQDDGRGRGGAAGAAGAYASSSSSGSGRGDREERRARYREASGRLDGRNSGRGGVSAGGGYYDEEVIVQNKERDTGRSRSRLRERSMEGERDNAYAGYRRSSRDRYDVAGPAAVVERRTSTRREMNYYPPAPQRLAVDRGGWTAGSTRGSSRDRSRPTRYDDDEAEVVYVRREPVLGGSRYSVRATSAGDPGRPISRYDDYR